MNRSRSVTPYSPDWPRSSAPARRVMTCRPRRTTPHWRPRVTILDLVNAIATADIAAEAVRISQQYADQLDRAYQIGLANHSDLLRVAVQTQRDRVTQRGAEAAVRSASAALATLLRLDPTTPLEPSERIVSPPTLVPIDTPLALLVKDALADRPELHSSQATLAALNRDRIAAKYAPLIPSLNGQASLSQLRGGPDDAQRGWSTAHDYIVGLQWRFGPGGLFDFTRTEAANAALQSAQLRADKLHDDVAGQVVQAYEAARAALDQMRLARHAVEFGRAKSDPQPAAQGIRGLRRAGSHPGTAGPHPVPRRLCPGADAICKGPVRAGTRDRTYWRVAL